MAKIYPSVRERRRYLLVRGAEGKEVVRAFRKWFGGFYEKKARLKVYEIDGETVVAVRRGYEDFVRALMVLEEFGGNPFVERVSGTLKKMREYIRHKSNPNINI